MLKNNNFIVDVENICREKNIDYIDAVVLWCDRNKLEIETAAYWIKKDPTMRSKIQSEAENLNYIKKSARLPL